jgi:hypothetical protein
VQKNFPSKIKRKENARKGVKNKMEETYKQSKQTETEFQCSLFQKGWGIQSQISQSTFMAT